MGFSDFIARILSVVNRWSRGRGEVLTMQWPPSGRRRRSLTGRWWRLRLPMAESGRVGERPRLGWQDRHHRFSDRWRAGRGPLESVARDPARPGKVRGRRPSRFHLGFTRSRLLLSSSGSWSGPLRCVPVRVREAPGRGGRIRGRCPNRRVRRPGAADQGVLPPGSRTGRAVHAAPRLAGRPADSHVMGSRHRYRSRRSAGRAGAGSAPVRHSGRLGRGRRSIPACRSWGDAHPTTGWWWWDAGCSRRARLP